jgi:hypothetical protein
MDLSEIEIEIRSLEREFNSLTTSLINDKKKRGKEKQVLLSLIKAREIFKKISDTIKKKVKHQIEPLITMAIQTVYDRPFEYVLNYKETENNVLWESQIKEGNKIYEDVEEELGGGITDIIALPEK